MVVGQISAPNTSTLYTEFLACGYNQTQGINVVLRQVKGTHYEHKGFGNQFQTTYFFTTQLKNVRSF